jgi:hypothetical protein
MPEYKNGRIYTIRCYDDPSLIYVGSTTRPLCYRFSKHKGHSREERCKNMLLYTTIREDFGDDWSKFYIELYEEYPCENKEQLNKREGQIIREIGTLNRFVAGRTKQEYDKEYYNENADKLKQYQTKYRANNVDKKKETDKNYYEANKEKILQRIKEKFTCECGSTFCISGKARHISSKKHQDYLKISLYIEETI